MQKLFIVGGAVLAFAAAALAGEKCGFTCANMCPLAKQANVLRACGSEATTVAKTVRAEVAAQVAKNLAKL